jgi:site-specific DNA-methyltransferase (adenine-specific)
MDFKSYIINADCFDEFKNIKDNTVDLVCVDLPYGQTACKWDTVIDLDKMWIELKRIGKDKTIYVFFCTTRFGHTIISSNKKWFRYDLIWSKSKSVGFLNANNMPLRKHEMIYVFYKKKGTYNPQKTKGKPYKTKGKGTVGVYNSKRTDSVNKGDRHPLSILEFKSPQRTKHKTQKPVDLLEWIIKSYSNENDIVLDFTMGSGSTIKACIKNNRKYIGIEKDKKIYETTKSDIFNDGDVVVINKQ